MSKFIGTKKFPNIKKINTKYLTQIIANDGQTDQGNDYGVLESYIVDELNHRALVNSERDNLSALHQLAIQEKLQSDSKQCTQCGTEYPKTDLHKYFYETSKGSNVFRPKCKACHIKNTLERRTNNNVPF